MFNNNIIPLKASELEKISDIHKFTLSKSHINPENEQIENPKINQKDLKISESKIQFDKKKNITTNFDGCFKLKQIGLLKENISSCSTELFDLNLRELNLLPWSS